MNLRAAVLIPCLNEERAIRTIVEGVLQHTPHVIVVDDGSSDGTVAALRVLATIVAAVPPKVTAVGARR